MGAIWLSPLVGLLSLCLVITAQAQTLPDVAANPPQRATADVIMPLCFELRPAGGLLIGPAREDLRARCTELVNDARAGSGGTLANVQAGLQGMAAEEVATQGRNTVETSYRNIGARLAALRGGAFGIGLQRFTLQHHEPALPGTLVASLLPHAAVASAVPTATPSPFRSIGVFASGTLTTGDKDATSREAGFSFDTLGATVGVDYRFTNNLILGMAFSYLSTDVDLDMNGGALDTDGYNFSIYGTYYIANFYIDGIAGFGWNDYDIARNIRYSIRERNVDAALVMPERLVVVNQTARGDTDGRQYSFSVGGGYDFNISGWTVGPLVRMTYTKLDVDGYRERIDNTRPGFGLVLNFDDQRVESFTTVLGGQISYAISTGIGVLLPQVRFEWEHEFKNDRRTIRANFVHDPTPTSDPESQIRLVTDDPDRDFFNIGVGLSATFRGGVSAFVYYETVLGLEDVTRHHVALGIRKEF